MNDGDLFVFLSSLLKRGISIVCTPHHQKFITYLDAHIQSKCERMILFWRKITLLTILSQSMPLTHKTTNIWEFVDCRRNQLKAITSKYFRTGNRGKITQNKLWIKKNVKNKTNNIFWCVPIHVIRKKTIKIVFFSKSNSFEDVEKKRIPI